MCTPTCMFVQCIIGGPIRLSRATSNGKVSTLLEPSESLASLQSTITDFGVKSEGTVVVSFV